MMVSIIVPVYNVEPYLCRCIDSVLAQTYTDWELILVDDGSPDRCPAICDEYAARDQRIKVIHKANGGLSDARNHGLDVATGEYITFLDSDDYIHPHMLQRMTQMGVDEHADMVQCAYVRGTSDTFPTLVERGGHACHDGHSIFASLAQRVILCAKLYRRTLWEGIRMPVGQIHEDDATTWKLYYRSRKIVTLDTPYYYYYKNPQGIMGREARRFNPVLVSVYEDRIQYFVSRGEATLALLSRWSFCMPLMYIYLRGNITREEECRIRHLLCSNIALFVRCKQVPIGHRAVFSLLRVSPRFFRRLFVVLGMASDMK